MGFASSTSYNSYTPLKMMEKWVPMVVTIFHGTSGLAPSGLRLRDRDTFDQVDSDGLSSGDPGGMV